MPTTSRCASSTPARRSRRWSALAGARQQDAHRLGDGYAAEAEVHRPARVPAEPDLGELASLHRLGPVLPDLGPGRQVPDILRDEVVGSEAQRVFSDGKGCCPADRRPLAAGERRDRRCCRPTPSTTTPSRSDRRVARTTCAALVAAAAADQRPVIDGVRRPNRSLADFIAPKAARPDHIGLFAVTAGLGIEKKGKSSSPTTSTTTRRSC